MKKIITLLLLVFTVTHCMTYNANATVTREFSPIFSAAQDGNLELVKKLLEGRVNVNKVEDYGEDGATPLYIAALNNHLEIVEILINAKADINKATSFNTTPIAVSAYKGYTDLVKVFIKAGADVNKMNNSGSTPLFLAAQNGHLKIVKLLINAGADVNKSEKESNASPLLVAAQNGHLKIVKLLIDANCDLNKEETIDGRSPIYVATQNGHIAVVKALIKAGSNINKATKQGLTPLYIAAQNGYLKEVKILLMAKADTELATINNATPLYIAAQHGKLNIGKALIKAGADINKARKDGTTPVFIASAYGHKNMVKALIKEKANVNQTSISEGVSPLIVAAQGGYFDIVKILIKAGANLNIITNRGRTPLMISAYLNHDKIAKILVKNGADPYLKTSLGNGYSIAKKNPKLQNEIEKIWKKYLSSIAPPKNIAGCKDASGNPILRSIFLEEDNYKNYSLTSSYHTLKNNIMSKVSLSYISSNPSLDEIESVALSLESENFILTKNDGHLVAIFNINHQKKTFFTIQLDTGSELNFSTHLDGDISENRAKEIIKEKYDSNAKIEKGFLYFNGHKHKIIPYKKIKKALTNLIKKEGIDKATPSQKIIILSQKNLAKMIIRESKKNGKLDMFTKIEGHEFDGIQLEPGIYVTMRSASLYKWGLVINKVGVTSASEALNIFAKFRGRKLTDSEKHYIKKGYEDYFLKDMDCDS